MAARRPGDITCAVLEFPAIVLQDDAEARRLPDGDFPETSNVTGVTIGRKYNEDAVSFYLYAVLGEYTGPVLILHGDRDPIVPLRYSKRAAKVFPDAERIIMPGQGHGFIGGARAEAIKKRPFSECIQQDRDKRP